MKFELTKHTNQTSMCLDPHQKDEVDTINMFKPSSVCVCCCCFLFVRCCFYVVVFWQTILRRYSLVDPFGYLCFTYVFGMISGLFLAAL